MSTKIEWTDVTWNPVSGCSKLSAGCKNCYAERMAKRLQHMGTPGYDNGFAVTLHHDKLKQPFHWRKPKRIFVCSMADLFHEDVPNGFIQQVFSTMANNPHHTFQVLTKRSERMRDFVRGYVRGFDGVPLPNVWLGVSVENSDARRRIGHLLDTPAAFRFLSCEPLLEHVDLT